MVTTQVEVALGSLDPRATVSKYCPYFDSIRPRDNYDWFRRGLFAFSSVHTSWRKNVDLYRELWDLAWLTSRKDLHARIVRSGAGLSNNRTEYIWKFAEEFWKNPDFYRKTSEESWTVFRDRLQKATLGLGHAKTSFFIEMCYFQEAGVICIDTHILQAYGLTGNKSHGTKKMNEIESHWLSVCDSRGIPAVVGRWAYWDRKQNQSDSRYWSYALEGQPAKFTGSPVQMELWLPS